ncbi:ubiquitin-conjugating enzyme E2 1-like [Rutidosis leptorrhynchoides]|uniref:ubiquitin-conjugating enzyme E2 1-like n=1 Tax=Rutidosis leptorrhynchoides TaxID=125765 RepID=UPI003A98DADD
MSDGQSFTDQRIQNELSAIRHDNSGDITFEWDETNIRHLVATIIGPNATPYEGGRFKIDIHIPDGFPIKPPHVRFITKIWHLNICSKNGAIRLSLFDDDWSPGTGLENAMVSVQALLSAPDHYGDSSSFSRKARIWTRKYATADPPTNGTTKTSRTRPSTKTPAQLKDFIP